MRTAIFLVFLIGSNPVIAQQTTPKSDSVAKIEVTGVGQVLSTPDQFSFSLSIEEKGETASQLNSVIKDKTSRVIDRLLKLGVDEKSVQALQVRFSPWIEYQERKRIQQGFVLSRQITVTVNDLGIYERAIDAVLALGITSISNFSYSSSQAEQNYQRSLDQALLNAKARAEHMVSSLDLKLGKVISISELSQGQPVPTQLRMRSAEADSSYQPGEMTTQTKVRVVFSLL